MSRQQKIEAASKKASQCCPGLAGEEIRFIARRQIERVMCYHDFFDAIGKPAELSFHQSHLPVVDAAAFDRESPGRIDAG